MSIPLPDSGSTSWYPWAQQLDALARSSQYHPLSELRSDRLRLARNEAISVGVGVEQNLINITGPGNVEYLWMATPGFGATLDARLRVYYDGSATAAIDMDLGTLFAAHYGSAGQGHFTPHMRFQVNSGNGNGGFLITFSMPFGTSIRVTYTNMSGGALTPFYSQIAYSLYSTDRAGGMRLRGGGARIANQVTLTQAQTSTRLSVASGPGNLVWHSTIGGYSTATNLSWLERNVAISIDGEGSPSIVSTGFEDWFDGAWYYEGAKDFQVGPYSYVATNQPATWPNAVGQATDLLGKWGGIPWTSSISVLLQTEAACTTGHTFADSYLYYS